MAKPIAPKTPSLTAVQMAWLQEAGVDKKLFASLHTPVVEAAHATSNSVPKAGAHAITPARVPIVSARKARVKAEALPVATPQAEAVTLPDDWNELKTHVEQCQACPLHAERHLTVFGSGAEHEPDWMVIGEAPGDRDDRYGLPFQGKAGELLQAMLNAVGVGADEPVFYTNLLKCRPRGSRTPSPAELAACLPYMQRQIDRLRPARLLVLGRLAAHALVDEQADFEDLRGRVHTFESESGHRIPVVVTYHPASLLSRPQHKAGAWHDINLARSVIDR